MNILFLVSSFLLIFVFLNATILKNSTYFHSEKIDFCNYITTKRNLESRLEQYKYNQYKGKLPNSTSSPKKQKIQKKILIKDDKPNIPGASHRFNKNPHTLAKWNLAPLILTEKPSPYLQAATLVLLKDLYGHTTFWREAEKKNPKFENALIASFKEKKDSLENLSDLFPKDPALQGLFYKMLKGSSSYSVSKKEGYPPLEDFVSLDSKKSETIELSFACHSVLKALLGEEFTSAILELEKEKTKEKTQGYHTISEEEFRALIPTLGPDIPIQDLDSMISLTNQKINTEELIFENPQGISLKMPIPKISFDNEAGKKKT